MDISEIQEKQKKILDGLRLHLDAYYEKLGNLNKGLPNFDLDIATDLHPDLADFNSEAGHARLAFWDALAQGLETHPKYTLIRRYSTRKNTYRSPGIGHGGHLRSDAGINYSVEHAWVEVYKNLQPEAIRFGRDPETGVAYAWIHEPATVTQTEGADAPTVLFSSDAIPSAWDRDKQAIVPHFHEPEVFFYADDAELALNQEYLHVGDGLLRLPVQIDADLRRTILSNLRTSTEHSDPSL